MFYMFSFFRYYEIFWEYFVVMIYIEFVFFFVMFCNVLLYYMKSGEELFGRFGDVGEVYRIYKVWCVQCLVLGDYIKFWCYKFEVMIFYFGLEYFG